MASLVCDISERYISCSNSLHLLPNIRQSNNLGPSGNISQWVPHWVTFAPLMLRFFAVLGKLTSLSNIPTIYTDTDMSSDHFCLPTTPESLVEFSPSQHSRKTSTILRHNPSPSTPMPLVFCKLVHFSDVS